MAFNDLTTRTDVPVPDEVSNAVIKAVPEKSIFMERAQKVRMASGTGTQPVMTGLPEAHWVSGDSGLKQTTMAKWNNTTITAEELAVLVPIPDALINDSKIPLWAEIQPKLVEAIAVKLDSACMYGVEKPVSWPTALMPAAIAASNVVAPSGDLMVDIGTLGKAISNDGFAMDGFVAPDGYAWSLRTARDGNGRPIYEGDGKSVYSVRLDQSRTFPTAAAHLLAVDWTSVVMGMRQDMTWNLFNQMVVNDEDGRVIYNAAQQDGHVLRVVIRVGYNVAIPVIRGALGAQVAPANRYPAAVLSL